jgi:uncharacterized protein YaaR (DUF327 family)
MPTFLVLIQELKSYKNCFKRMFGMLLERGLTVNKTDSISLLSDSSQSTFFKILTRHLISVDSNNLKG